MLSGLKLWCGRHCRRNFSSILFQGCRIAIFLMAMHFEADVIAQTGAAWPEADKLFHSDPRWLGADAAFSIDLGGGRVLWMFGDTFIARKPGDTRTTAAFVHNTVAIQDGYDPSRASIKFYWRTGNNGPTEMFPSERKVWMWPSSGIRIGGALILFCGRVAADHSKNSLGFRGVGWTAYRVSNPDDEPTAWMLNKVSEDRGDLTMASAVLREGSFVYLLGDMGDQHDLYLARLSVDAVAKSKLRGLEWWSGNDWQTNAQLRRPLVREAGSESSLQRDPRGQGFLEINSQGFGATDIVMRHAPRLEGPWSEPQKIYRPPESDAPDAFVYAGKSHSELKGADLVLTYAANGDDKKLATDMSLYFPRFAQVELRGHVTAETK